MDNDNNKKNSKPLIITLILIVVIFVGAAVAYSSLKETAEVTVSKTALNLSDLPADTQKESQQAEVISTADMQSTQATSPDQQAVDTKDQEASAVMDDSVAEETSTSAAEEKSTSTTEESAEEEKIAFPDFPITRLDGTTGNFYDDRAIGKITVINSFASWCPPCKAELPYFISASETYADDVNFMFFDNLDGTRETEATIKDFVAQTFPSTSKIYLDPGYVNSIVSSNSLPTTIFLDREGTYMGSLKGGISEQNLKSILDSLI